MTIQDFKDVFLIGFPSTATMTLSHLIPMATIAYVSINLSTAEVAGLGMGYMFVNMFGLSALLGVNSALD